MKLWRLITFLATSLLWSAGYSAPNSIYKNGIELLEKERNRLKNERLQSFYKPSSWQKYATAKKMLYLFRSAKVLESVHFPERKKKIVDIKSYKTAFATVHSFLQEVQVSIQRPSSVGGSEKNFIPEQDLLDKRILEMNTLTMAKLISETNRTIPPICGNSKKGTVHTEIYNLIYHITNTAHYENRFSLLELEILQEYREVDRMPFTDYFDGLQPNEIIKAANAWPLPKARKNHGRHRKNVQPRKTAGSVTAQNWVDATFPEGALARMPELLLPLPPGNRLPLASTSVPQAIMNPDGNEVGEEQAHVRDISADLAQYQTESNSANEDYDLGRSLDGPDEEQQEDAYDGMVNNTWPKLGQHYHQKSLPSSIPGFIPFFAAGPSQQDGFAPLTRHSTKTVRH